MFALIMMVNLGKWAGEGGEHNTVQFMPAFVILTLVFLKKMLGIEHGSKSVDLKSWSF